MTVGVRNYPRKPLTDRERTIRATLARMDNATPYIFVPLEEAPDLNTKINGLTNGGVIWLEEGTYPGNITVSVPNVEIWGVGSQSTILSGSITGTRGNLKIRDLCVRATGQSYGIKLYHSGGDMPRCELHNLTVGASAYGAGDGPTTGIYLDGTILMTARQCNVSFNTGAGLYVNTSSGTYTTNVHLYENCTFNGNGTYGVAMEAGGDGVAGMMLHQFFGGNIEDNGTASFYCDNSTGVHLRGIDFETAGSIAAVTNTNLVSINSSQPVILEGCNFVTGAGATVTRAFLIGGCAQVTVHHNRFDGFPVGAIGVIAETCVQVQCYGNIPTSSPYPTDAVPQIGRWINNRGSHFGFTA